MKPEACFLFSFSYTNPFNFSLLFSNTHRPARVSGADDPAEKAALRHQAVHPVCGHLGQREGENVLHCQIRVPVLVSG